MQDMTSMAVVALSKTIEYQGAIIKLADTVTDEKKKRRLYRAALKADKAAKELKVLISDLL